MIRLRRASASDARVLGGMNRQMIEDEGYKGRLSLPRLEERMRDWLRSGEYQAVFFVDEKESRIGYALFQMSEDALFFSRHQVFLRHFFIARDHRRKGAGTEAFNALKEGPWKDAGRVDLRVLIRNRRGIGFWRSLGFEEYQYGMELGISKS